MADLKKANLEVVAATNSLNHKVGVFECKYIEGSIVNNNAFKKEEEVKPGDLFEFDGKIKVNWFKN